LPLICSVCADELSDLKEQLTIMQQEKIEQEKHIEALQRKIKILENEKQDSTQKLKELEAAKTDTTPKKESWKTDVTVKYYWDTREFNTFGIYTSTTGLPLGLSVWGFVDIHGNQDEIQDAFDQTRYFLEYRLSKNIDPNWVGGIKGLGVQAEYNDSDGSSNEVVRLGLTYKHNIPAFGGRKGWIQWRGFPYETDGSGQQASWGYFLPITERISISGFADWNLQEGTDDRWVIEPQVNYKINDRFSFLIEYRYSGFEAASAASEAEGIAIGMDMKF